MDIDTASVALRALGFVVLFQAAGMALFLAAFGNQLRDSIHAIQRYARLSAFAAAALLVAQYLLEAGRMGGGFASVLDPSLQAIALHSKAAPVLALRLASLAAVVTLRTRAGAALALALLAGSFWLTGHTSTHPSRWLLGSLLCVHVLIVAFWFGALIPLYVATRREVPAVASALAAAFSRGALWIVPLLAVAGAIIAAVLLGSWHALRSTYGALLLAKLAGFGALMILASLNKWRLAPALGTSVAAREAFRRSLVAEYALIAIVLGVTATLTALYSPP